MRVRLGADSSYLHKHPLPGFEICGAYLHICVLRVSDWEAASTYLYHYQLSAYEINGVDGYMLVIL